MLVKRVKSRIPAIMEMTYVFDESIWLPDQPELYKDLILFKVKLAGSLSVFTFPMVISKGADQLNIAPLVPDNTVWGAAETRRKRAESNTGKKRTAEFCAALSKSRTGSLNPSFGKKQSPETKKKRSAALLNNANSKTTYQYDMKGVLIREWPSMGEAWRNTGISSSKICACCKGRKPQAGGFIWSYTRM